MSPDIANVEQAQFWADMAPTWLEVEERLEEISGPPGHMAMDRLGLGPGQRVLDLGCGTGRTTVELAERVGPTGEVVGVDISAELLASGRQRLAELGVANVDFVQADVQVGDLGSDQFDAAFSRFGVMFFTDPVAAFTNIRAALRPHGALSFACWQGVFDNEWMLIPGAAAMSVTGTIPPMPGPEEPGPFAFADPDRVRSVLGSAGFHDVEVTAHSEPVEIEEARIADTAATSMRVGAVREALRDADDATHQQVLAAIEEAFRSRLQDGRVLASRGVWLVTARA